MICTVFLFVNMYFVYGLAVSSFYPVGMPLKMTPGSEQNIFFELQNQVGEQDFDVMAEVVDGKEIAKITDKSNIYSIPAHTKGQKINLRIDMPESALVGDKYNVSIYIRTVDRKEGGGISLGLGMQSRVYIEVVEGKSSFEPEENVSEIIPEKESPERVIERNYVLYYIAGIIISMLFVAWVIWLFKKKK